MWPCCLVLIQAVFQARHAELSDIQSEGLLAPPFGGNQAQSCCLELVRAYAAVMCIASHKHAAGCYETCRGRISACMLQ